MISGKALRVSWRSARRGLRGREGEEHGPPSPFGLWRGSLRSLRCDGLSGLAQPKLAKRAKAGGARRDRTADLVIANDALSQLSYGPVATARSRRMQSAVGAIY